jgi:glutathione reductase (NADPH)
VERDFDVVVIGSGSAGTAVATAVRARGKTVAVVDHRPFGGTCALRGCDPKKVFVHAASVIAEVRDLAGHGIFQDAPALHWRDLLRFKRSFTDPVPEQRLKTYRDAGIEALQGRAIFKDVATLDAGGQTLRARTIVVAAGAKPRHVAPGDDALLTSEAFMELETLPDSLVFAGGGFVTFEFAHVAARAGCRVTILHNDAHPLAGFDPDVVARLVAATRELGIDVRLETPVKRVERTAHGVRVHAESGGKPVAFEAASGVLGAGRVPDIDDMALDAAHVERTNRGVRVNEYLQSPSNPIVYAAGDAADGGAVPLTPVAAYEGEIAAANILDGNHARANFAGLASIVYTTPPLGSAGESEAQVRERGADSDVRAGDMSEWYQTRHVAAPGAYYKVVLEKGTRKLLGATIFGPHAQEQINLISLAIRHGLKAGDLSGALFAYPTGASDFEYMLAEK